MLRHGALKRIILAALRAGPKTTRKVASALQAVKTGLGDREAYVSVRASLGDMRACGVVVREGKACVGGRGSPRLIDCRPL